MCVVSAQKMGRELGKRRGAGVESLKIHTFECGLCYHMRMRIRCFAVVRVAARV
ncbi:hypothetical protein TM5383_01541 [Thalassovita mediterranea]|jgi:hypothetical protein|uniref:Uncharacterized protein n=1 Tax=Thalassovita mediterranea TaxID=340021 RepID=A0A0P1GPB2_9RHOB|nr:hypothetical protein TM5383_01541 [Thalassovita mediterranea]SIS31877.1 hypothetical protein SAMN05421685_105137 [Thalassovita mediterranea]